MEIASRRMAWLQGFAVAAGLALLCLAASPAAGEARERDAGTPAEERIGLDAPFGPGMVLQRDLPIRLWGRAGPGETIRVRLGAETVSTRADARGRWDAVLPPRPAGGPYTLEASGTSFDDRFDDVMIGEVWLCSGQSNMQFRLSHAVDVGKGFPTDSGLRLLDLPRRQDRAPALYLAAPRTWISASPSAAADFSAVCLGFGRRLRAALDVPVGLIGAAWGGTRIGAFVDADTLDDRGLAHPAEQEPDSRQNDGRVFNGMIAPLAPLSLRGVLWYQGESNAHHTEGYADELAALAASWRKAFERALPFVVVQLPAFQPPDDPPGTWAALRNEQRKFVERDPNADLVVLVDQGEAHNLHPTRKQVVADRAATVALAHVYRRNVVAHGPVPRRVRQDARSIVIEYANAEGLTLRGDGALPGFSICARACAPVSARIEGIRVRLEVPVGIEPERVRYAWSDVPEVRLFNDAGLPAEPFDVSLRPSAGR